MKRSMHKNGSFLEKNARYYSLDLMHIADVKRKGLFFYTGY